MKPADSVDQFPQLSSVGIVGGTVDQTPEQNLLHWSFSSLSWSSSFPSGKRVLECGAMSEEPTEEQIRDEVNKFLINQVALSGLSMEASAELLRLVLLVNKCEQTKGSESDDEMSV